MFLRCKIFSSVSFRKLYAKFLHTETENAFRPRRAVLYVPGNDERKIQKTFNLGVDCAILDCEDGVAQNKKVAARENIRNLFDTQGDQLLNSKTEWAVRTNSVDTIFCQDDLSTLFSGTNVPATLFLPKVQNTEDLIWVSEQLQKNLIENTKKINLIFYIETARGLINMIDICNTATKLDSLNPVGVVFGSDDFCADIGASRTENSIEILYARQKVLSIAKAFKLQAIDMVYIQFKDLEGLKQQCERGLQMGYTGKQVIHPMQVEIVQNSFLPSQETVDWATNLLKAFQEHQKEGKGAFVFKGSMIDMPTMKQAQNIITVINMVEKK